VVPVKVVVNSLAMVQGNSPWFNLQAIPSMNPTIHSI